MTSLYTCGASSEDKYFCLSLTNTVYYQQQLHRFLISRWCNQGTARPEGQKQAVRLNFTFKRRTISCDRAEIVSSRRENEPN
jgi:hypothetical protein